MVLCIATQSCVGTFHLSCLAKKGLEKSGEWKTQLFPVAGAFLDSSLQVVDLNIFVYYVQIFPACCPVCGGSYRWGDIVRAQHDTVEVMKAHPEQETMEGMIPKMKIRMIV